MHVHIFYNIIIFANINRYLLRVYLQTFTGNTDATTVVENQLAFPVSARCVRLHPLTFTGWGDLSIEVYGCPSV